MIDEAPVELLNRMSGWNKTVRQQAVQQAKTLPPDALLDLMQQGKRRLQRRHRQRWTFFLIYIVAGSIAAGFMDHSTFIIWKYMDRVIFQVVLFGLAITLVPSLKVSLTEIVAGMEEAIFAPHLLTLLSTCGLDHMENQIALPALTHLLPQLRREQADALTPQQRQILVRPLIQSLNVNKRRKVSLDLAVAILKALEQVGDKRELPLVEQLAAIHVRCDHDKQIQQAAQECLLYLQIRVEEQQQQTTLLRASDTCDSSGDALLRAAASYTTTPEEQLLRPSVQHTSQL